MDITDNSRCIVNISHPSVYAFESDGNSLEEILQEAIDYKAKSIEKWKSILLEAPTVEWAKIYLEADSKAEFVIMTYSEFEIEQREVLLSDPLSEITEERFNDMLEVLPPYKWCTIGSVELFCCSEMLTGLYASQYAHEKESNKFYTKVVDTRDKSTWINTVLENNKSEVAI